MARLLCLVVLLGIFAGCGGVAATPTDPARMLAALDHGGTSGLTDAAIAPYAAALEAAAPACLITPQQVADMVALIERTLKAIGGPAVSATDLLQTLTTAISSSGVTGAQSCESALGTGAGLDASQ